ncbi:MAG: PEGA domain-containing protein [Prevotellaceae bacterium]|jgi:hypothetical protein|nr:PEGA domain-containing protein [Prevotellaceae bacterium]
MKKLFCRLPLAIALLACVTASAQNLAVESFARDDSDQSARIKEKRTDQNNKVCAIIKIETPLLLKDFTFDVGMAAVEHTEQRTGEIWLWLSPGVRKLTIQHAHLGVVRNYPLSEALKEATVYIMRLRSGSVRTVVEDNVQLQYIEVECNVAGATIKIDNEKPEVFTNGKFSKAVSYGKHRYTVEAPMYHPESGIREVTVEKSAPLTVELRPQFGQLTINTTPEPGAEVFIDDEKRGKSPLTIGRLKSGTHKIRVVKPQFLPAEQKQTIADGATESLTLTMQPNFAVITLTAPDGGDIYINDEKKATAQWKGRLTPGPYKVEVRKPSHRSSVKAITSEAGKNETIRLAAPTPIYGALNVKEKNVKADIFIDGKKYGKTPNIIKNLLVGKHFVELRAEGYKPSLQEVEVREGKEQLVAVQLQEEEKTGSLTVTANIPVSVGIHIDGKYMGSAPLSVTLPVGAKKVAFDAPGYRPLTATVFIKPGKNKVYGELKQKLTAKVYQKLTDDSIDPVILPSYRISPPTSYFGLSGGYCKTWGVYGQFRVKDKNVRDIDKAFYGGEKKYVRLSLTAGGMLRLFELMYIYGGLGYGQYGAVYQTDNNAGVYYYYTSGLTEGLELEYGATFRCWKYLTLTAGYSTIAGSDFGELHFGVGVLIP